MTATRHDRLLLPLTTSKWKRWLYVMVWDAELSKSCRETEFPVWFWSRIHGVTPVAHRIGLQTRSHNTYWSTEFRSWMVLCTGPIALISCKGRQIDRFLYARDFFSTTWLNSLAAVYPTKKKLDIEEFSSVFSGGSMCEHTEPETNYSLRHFTEVQYSHTTQNHQWWNACVWRRRLPWSSSSLR